MIEVIILLFISIICKLEEYRLKYFKEYDTIFYNAGNWNSIFHGGDDFKKKNQIPYRGYHE